MRNKLTITTLLTPILLALFFVSAGNVFGRTPDPNRFYQIKARHSGKCLQIDTGPRALWNGTPVVQWACSDAQNQQWTFTPIGAGYYKIIARHSGKVMDVFGGIFSTANNVDVQQRDYNGSANQMWHVDDLGTYYSIIAKHSGRGLNIRGGSTDDGAQAIQYDWREDYTNSQWILTEVPNTPACNSADSLNSTFVGTAELRTTNPNAPGPYPSAINLGVKFSNCRTQLSITDVPAITLRVNTPLGPNDISVTMPARGPGSFDSSNGGIVLPLTLGITNSIMFLGNSTLPLRLTAEGADMEDLVTGRATLRGTGTFVGGALNGFQGSLIVTGIFSPRPR